jgi:ribosomal protein L28
MRLKTTKSLILAASLAATAVAASWMKTPITAAQDARESANGQGTLLVLNSSTNEYVRRQFSFSAQRRPDGTVKGTAVLHNPAFTVENGQKYQLQISITCMKVVGNTAIFGGTTRRTNDPNLVDAVFFSVQDNGEPGMDRDKISRVFFWDEDPNTQGDPQSCQFVQPTDFPLETIESGNVQVRGGATAP